MYALNGLHVIMQLGVDTKTKITQGGLDVAAHAVPHVLRLKQTRAHPTDKEIHKVVQRFRDVAYFPAVGGNLQSELYVVECAVLDGGHRLAQVDVTGVAGVEEELEATIAW